jgi:hypothetical protein
VTDTAKTKQHKHTWLLYYYAPNGSLTIWRCASCGEERTGSKKPQ